MADIDPKTLRLLVAVCDQQNITRAARLANIEPSAISKRIAQLEADLGTRLLKRGRRGVQPTDAGLAMLEHARRVLFTLDRMTEEASSFAGGVKGHVRLLATASAIAESLMDDVALFMRQPDNRNIRVDIEERLSVDLVRHVRDGMASIGVCWDDADLSGMQQRRYRQDHLALAVHPDLPLARFKRLRLEQTLDHDHVGLQPSNAVQRMLQRAAAQLGRPISYRVIVSNFEAAFRVVGANLAVSVLPVEIASSYATTRGIRLIPLADSWSTRNFAICFTSHEALQPAARRMVEHLVAQAASQRQGTSGSGATGTRRGG